jgi:hypothetical protein
MVKIYEEADLAALDKICDEVYNRTYDDVTKYLTRMDPLGAAGEEVGERALLPQSVQYRHAPDGDKVDEMAKRLFGGDVPEGEELKALKREIENNIIASIKHAVSDALTSMNKRERFSGRHRAFFNVTKQSVTLARLQPISIPRYD